MFWILRKDVIKYSIAFLCIAGLFLPVFTFADSVGVSVEVVIYECNDGLDNDTDGFTDYPDDPDCDSASDNSEEVVIYACDDSLDNDGDGLVDYPSDPGCDSSTDDSEVNLPTQNNQNTNTGGGGGGGTSNKGPSGQDSQDTTTLEFNGIAEPNSNIIVFRNLTPIDVFTVDSSGIFSFELIGEPVGTFSYSLSVQGKNGFAPAQTYQLQNSASGLIKISDIKLFFTNLISDVKGDINGDKRINITDFSIVAYWFERPLDGDILVIEKTLFNGDGIIDLVDMSIMAYYWTG